MAPNASPTRSAARAVAVAVGLAVLAVLAFVVEVVRGDAATSPPAADAAKLVPADALVYLHLSTDTDRDAVEEAPDLAERFPAFPRLHAAVGRLLHCDRRASRSNATFGHGWATRRRWRSWNTRSQTAGLLVVLDVADRKKADAPVAGGGHAELTEYRGADVLSYGKRRRGLRRRFPGDRPAGGRAGGHRRPGRWAPSLSRNDVYCRATDDLADGCG